MRVPDQNGVSPLYITLEIHRSGQEPSNYAWIRSAGFCYMNVITFSTCFLSEHVKNLKLCLSMSLSLLLLFPLQNSFIWSPNVLCPNRLVGLVVRRPPRERNIRCSNPACARFFRGRVIPVILKLALQWLPWRYRVSAVTGRPGVSIL